MFNVYWLFLQRMRFTQLEPGAMEEEEEGEEDDDDEFGGDDESSENAQDQVIPKNLRTKLLLFFIYM